MSFPPLDSVLDDLRARGVAIPDGPVELTGFGDSPELSASLIELIVSGKKTAGTGLVWAHEHDGEVLPAPGNIEIVLDWEGRPAVITRVSWSAVVPFDEVTAEYAVLEGEGDLSLEYWREAHTQFFARECARIGREPKDDMPVACAVFEVVAVVE